MKRTIISLCAAAGLAACGGDAPFGQGEETATDGSTGAAEIPTELAGQLTSFTYDADSETLSITGIAGDGNAVDGAYRRRPALDRGGYEAYTAQTAANGRHSTVYVREIDGTRAAVVATGVQYENRYAGTAYANDSYTPRVAVDSTDPDSGIVIYTGRYIGLLNGPGSNEDVTAPNPGEDPSVLTSQAAEITGEVQITADFATSNVDGVIYNRELTDFDDPDNPGNPIRPADIALEGTAIAEDGTFFGTAEQDNTAVGEYGGIFGGEGATAVAGSISVENHIEGVESEEEFGIFVLDECAPPASGPDCNLGPAPTP